MTDTEIKAGMPFPVVRLADTRIFHGRIENARAVLVDGMSRVIYEIPIDELQREFIILTPEDLPHHPAHADDGQITVVFGLSW